jgi:hypothetical protein
VAGYFKFHYFEMWTDPFFRRSQFPRFGLSRYFVDPFIDDYDPFSSLSDPFDRLFDRFSRLTPFDMVELMHEPAQGRRGQLAGKKAKAAKAVPEVPPA